MIKKVLFIVAMEAEAQPTVDMLGIKRDDSISMPPNCPAVVYSGTYQAERGEVQVWVACNGKCKEFGVDNVGTVPAALTTFLAVQAVVPDVVINAGTCGGFSAHGAAIGDVFLSTAVANHDRRIQLPGFDKYGVGRADCLGTAKLRGELGLKEGVVTTGNSLDWNEDDLRQMKANGAVCKEMEAAAVGWACNLHSVPFFCIKSVTDIVDGSRPTHEEFLENLGAAAKALQKAIVDVLKAIGGRDIADL